uniref:Uncharacterized protein n=1 Tax=Meloidogyne enterolobii TaxID=390850 RepID=A0A6V7VFY2_MELEN|nr:unnamed protein product [Meloidogyne enterolobii]
MGGGGGRGEGEGGEEEGGGRGGGVRERRGGGEGGREGGGGRYLFCHLSFVIFSLKCKERGHFYGLKAVQGSRKNSEGFFWLKFF